MDQVKDDKDSWVERAGDLVEAYRDLITIKVVERTSLGASLSAVRLLTFIVGLFVLLFTGLGFAWWLGDTLNDMKVGFFIVGGVYTMVLFIVMALSRKVLVPRIRDMIVKEIYEED